MPIEAGGDAPRRGPRRRGTCPRLWFLLLLMAGRPATADVLTESLQWQSASVASGLARLKNQFLDVSILKDVEFVGAVFRTPEGTIRFSQGRGRVGEDTVTFRVRLPRDAELIGFWHTHGSDGPLRAVFSRTDAELVRSSGLPFYLITPEGDVRVLRPEHVASGTGMRVGRLPRGAHRGERLITGTAPGDADVTEV